MKKIFFILVSFFASANIAMAQTNDNYLSVGMGNLRSGNITIHDVPNIIAWIINTIIQMAGVISIFCLIFFALKMQVASGITGDTTKVDSARKWMIASGVGFIISVSAWFIMGYIVNILIKISGN